MIKKKIKKSFYLTLFIFVSIFYILMRNNYFYYYCPDCSHRGDDFLYLPIRLLIEGVNFYEMMINDKLLDHSSRLQVQANGPVYGLVYYFIFLPFGFLKFDQVKEIWLIINCIIIIHIFLIIYRKTIISQKNITIVFLIFLFSKATVYSIALGQYTLIVLYGFTYFFFKKKKLIKIFLIICSLAKFTFAPVLGLYLIFRKEYFLISILILCNIIAIILFCFLFKTTLVKTTLDQFIIPSLGYTSGAFDIMTLIGNHPRPPFNFLLVIISSIFFYIYYYKNTARNSLSDLASVSLITIIFFRHLYYDLIFLLPFLVFLFTEKKINKLCILSVIYFYFFYFNSFTYTAIIYNKLFMFINFLIISYNLFYLFIKTKKNEEIY